MSDFVKIIGGEFFLGGNRFYPLGTNAYYLHKFACSNDTNSIHEIFNTAKKLGMNTVRTWAFSEGTDPNNIYTLQSSPFTWNENSFQKLDYVIKTAKEYNVKLILTLVNNWDDFGGMNQYLNWYVSNKGSTKEEPFSKKETIKNNGSESYIHNISSAISHDDFYKIDTVKSWYKAYVQYILERVNIFTGKPYKNEETIMAFELANEPESTDKTGAVIYDWICEMSTFFKNIDGNHLLSTGESGFDINSNGYGRYPSWLLNGEKGISFKMNCAVKDIDYSTAHLYAEQWKIKNGFEWIFDHDVLSKSFNKPFLLGEYGAYKNRKENYNSWLKAVKEVSAGGALLWQLTPESFKDEDGYALKYNKDFDICNFIKDRYSDIINKSVDIAAGFIFSNVYPSPAKNEFYIKFNLEKPGPIKYSLYNVLGEIIISGEKMYSKGSSVLLINVSQLATGIYFVKLENESKVETKKVVVVR